MASSSFPSEARTRLYSLPLVSSSRTLSISMRAFFIRTSAEFLVIQGYLDITVEMNSSAAASSILHSCPRKMERGTSTVRFPWVTEMWSACKANHLNFTKRPHSSLLDDPNSFSPDIWDFVKTGPSLHTLESSMTQHPQTPAPHFM